MPKTTASPLPAKTQLPQKIVIAVGAFCLGLAAPLVGLCFWKSSTVSIENQEANIPVVAYADNEIVLTSHHVVQVEFGDKQDGTEYFSDAQKQILLNILKEEMSFEANEQGSIIASARFSVPQEIGDDGIRRMKVASNLFNVDAFNVAVGQEFLRLPEWSMEDVEWEIFMLPDGSFEFQPGFDAGPAPGYQG